MLRTHKSQYIFYQFESPDNGTYQQLKNLLFIRLVTGDCSSQAGSTHSELPQPHFNPQNSQTCEASLSSLGRGVGNVFLH